MICRGTNLLHLRTHVILLQALQLAGPGVDENTLWLLPGRIAAKVVLASLPWWLFASRVLRLKDPFTARSHPRQTSVCAAARMARSNLASVQFAATPPHGVRPVSHLL
jgi:hypothetical protein